MPEPIIIDNINLGGLSDSIYSGVENSVYKLVGIDLHSVPGLLKVRQKLAADSGGVVDEFVKENVEASNGDIYFFSADSGKIWKEGGTYTLAHTTTPDKGEAKCLGAWEYSGYIYWATEKRLHRIPVSGLSDWGTNAEEDWVELDLDQDELGGTGQTYTLGTSIDEGATHRQTFTPKNSSITAVGVNISAKGTGNWTVTVHDSSDSSQGSKTITNANLSAGWNIFEFSSAITLTPGTTYHIHITDTTGDGVVVTNVASDLEGGNIKVYATSDSSFHPMKEVNLVLFIGDRHFVHQVEKQTDGSHLFTRQALDVNEPFRAKTLGKIGTDLLIGTAINDTIKKAKIYRWNTWSVSFTNEDEIAEEGINAFIPSEGGVFVNAGLAGRIYFYNGEELTPYKRIPGEYSPTKQGRVNPNAVGTLRGQSVIGFSNVQGNPADQGIYVWGRYDRNYPYVLDLSFPISQRSGGNLVLSGVEIGSILVSGDNLYVTWKEGANYEVDKLDYSAKLENAYIESRVTVVERETQQNFGSWFVPYRTYPSGTDIDISYKKNHAGSYTAFAESEELDDTDRMMVIVEKRINANTLQMRVDLLSSGNDAPEIENMAVYVG